MRSLRVLTDECVDPRVCRLFPHNVLARSVVGVGWAGKKNGELVRLAAEQFDVLFTVDQNMRFQTSLAGIELCVVVAPSNLKNVADFAPYVSQLIDSTSQLVNGEFLVLR